MSTGNSKGLNPILVAKGHNGSVELYADRVRIRREGVLAFLTQGIKGDKDILLSQISSVQFRDANVMLNGYIQFAFLGGQEGKAGIFQAGTDENTVMFRNSQSASFRQLKGEVETRMGKATITNSTSSVAEELAKLAALREKGLLTDEEFSHMKRKLLGL